MTAPERRSGEVAVERTPRRTESTVPDLIGLNLEQACEAAAWAGIKLNATGTRNHGRVGVVVAQSPPPGTSTVPLRQIDVSVSAPGLVTRSTEARATGLKARGRA